MTSNEQTTVNELAREVRALRGAVNALDVKVDGVVSTIDKASGVVALFRWLGIGGIVVVVAGLLRAFGAV